MGGNKKATRSGWLWFCLCGTGTLACAFLIQGLMVQSKFFGISAIRTVLSPAIESQVTDSTGFMEEFFGFGHTSSVRAEGRSDTVLSPALQSALLARGLGWRSYKAGYHKLDTHP